MKKLTYLFILLISSINIFSQYGNNFPVKQITSFNFDVRNPQFLINSGYSTGNQGFLIFEAHSDSSINIGVLNYDAEGDTFFNPIMLTNNNGDNINPVGAYFYNKNRIIFYQTNLKGTWDIAYVEYKNDQWTIPTILIDSSGNETNPSFIVDQSYDGNQISIVFEKDSSIYRLTETDSTLAIDTIFEKNDSLYYIQPTAFSQYIYAGQRKTYFAAKEIDNKNNARIVLSSWSSNKEDERKILVDSGFVDNPKFYQDNTSYLFFESKADGYKSIFDIDYTRVNSIAEKLIYNPHGDITSLSISTIYPVLTKNSLRKISGPSFYWLYTYKLIKNDSAFIRTGYDFNYDTAPNDSLFYTRVTNSKPGIGALGLFNNYYIYYYLWEDSLNGKINFMGKKVIESLGAVEPRVIPQNYQLYQNYPNPFNPSTKIKFYIPKNNNVKLVIYNVLGEKVKTLIDGYMFSGEHEIEFLPANKASGIYFYQLVAGNYTLVKKMIYLK